MSRSVHRLRAWASRGERRRLQGEAGVSLVLAMAFLTLFAVLIVALLGYAASSFHASGAVNDQARTIYSASGGVDSAIARLKKDPAGCSTSGLAPYLTYAPPDGGSPADVQCGTGPVDTSAPDNALLTLVNSGDGSNVSGDGTLGVTGSVYSNSAITLAGASKLDASSGLVTAEGACSPDPATSPGQWLTGDPAGPLCGSAGDATGNDPGYTSRLPVDPTSLPQNPGPTCAGGGATLSFGPGFYTNATAFNSPAYGSCAAGRLFLKPGPYYFEFSPTTTWTIPTGTTVVGGTPTGWNPNTSGSVPPAPDSSGPKACTGTPDGVQLVFGGDSRLVVQDGAKVELCAQQGSGSPIALFGQNGDVGGGSGPTTLSATTTVARALFDDPAGSWRTIEVPGTPTAYSTGVISGSTGSITLGGFDVASIPTGAQITGVTLRVSHRQTCGGNGNACGNPWGTSSSTNGPNYVIEPLSNAAACGLPQPLDRTFGATWPQQPESFDLLTLAPGCFDTVTKLGQASFRLTAQVKSNATVNAFLDGIDIVVNWTLAGYRGQTCTASASCSFVSITGGPKVSVWGTTYARSGRMDVNFATPNNIVFNQGVVVGQFLATVPAGVTTTGSLRGRPGQSFDLTATVNSKLVVRAQFQVVGNSVRKVTRVAKWSVKR